MMKLPCVVISQPMYFPWVGLLEQIRLCQTFVFYDDVQFSRGSFSNRVQLKTPSGIRWLTIPLQNQHLGQRIQAVQINQRLDWRSRHREQLRQAYLTAPCRDEMLALVDELFQQEFTSLAELAKASVLALVDYFELGYDTVFYDASTLGVFGQSSQRVVDINLALQAKTYLTGHGARHYLTHEAFEAQGIDVAYIDYGLRPYPQQYGEFTPYVTALDLIANCGKKGLSYLGGHPVPWRTFLAKQSHAEESE